MPIAPDEQYVPEPVPDPQSLPDTLYEQTACPDDGAQIRASHIRRIAESYHTDVAIVKRETGILEDAEAFNVAISEQVFGGRLGPDGFYHIVQHWYLNHSGLVQTIYEFGFDDSVIELPKNWHFVITAYHLNTSTEITLRRDLPGSAPPPMIKFGNGAESSDDWWFSIMLINHGGRLTVGPYSTNGTVFMGGGYEPF